MIMCNDGSIDDDRDDMLLALTCINGCASALLIFMIGCSSVVLKLISAVLLKLALTTCL